MINYTNVIDLKIIVNDWLKWEYEVSMTQTSVDLMRKSTYKEERQRMVRELCAKRGWCQRS